MATGIIHISDMKPHLKGLPVEYPVWREDRIKLNDRDWLPPMCRACSDLLRMKRTYHRNVQIMFREHGSAYIVLHEQVGLPMPIMRTIVESLYAIKHV